MHKQENKQFLHNSLKPVHNCRYIFFIWIKLIKKPFKNT